MVNATTLNKVLYDPFGMPISGKNPGEIAPEELDGSVFFPKINLQSVLLISYCG